MNRCLFALYEGSNIHHFDSNGEKAIFVQKKTFILSNMLKQFFCKVLFGAILLVLVSCASGQQKQDFNTSKVYTSVKCQADTNVSYALFLPPQYKKGKPCPLLILFDSHGDGLFPVNLFNKDAAKSGFILAGSNNSKNGLPTEQTTDFYRKMIADLTARFDIEKRAIYVCGFSGGSRVAGAVAITEAGIAGVVGCGAGLPNINQKPANDFSYLAVVGSRDFNFTEMKQLDASLEEAGFRHHLLVFDGIHQWPPEKLIPDIFSWILFDAMRQKAIPEERKDINAFIERNDKIASGFETEGKLHLQQDSYIKMLHYLQGLTDVAPLQAEIKRLSAEKEVIDYRNQQNVLLALEQKLQQEYLPLIPEQSIEWWANEAGRLRALSQNEAKPELSQVYQRLLGSLSMNSYMYCTNALRQKDLSASTRFIEIYRLVDPSNAEHRFMAAKVAALNKDGVGVFEALKQAFDLGFKDINRVTSDVDIKPFLGDERIRKLIENK